MEGISAGAAVITFLGTAVLISSDLCAAADIKSTDRELKNIKAEVQNLVPVSEFHIIFLISLSNPRKVLNFAGSVLERCKADIQVSDEDQLNGNRQILTPFHDECKKLCQGLEKLAGEQKKRGIKRLIQWISRDRERVAEFNFLRNRLERVRATLNLCLPAAHLKLSQQSKTEPDQK
jgi:hypothetical protein